MITRKILYLGFMVRCFSLFLVFLSSIWVNGQNSFRARINDNPQRQFLDIETYKDGFILATLSLDNDDSNYYFSKYNYCNQLQFAKRYQINGANIIKIDNDGDIFSKRITAENIHNPKDFQVLFHNTSFMISEKEFYVIGRINHLFADSSLICILKYNNGGKLIWSKILTENLWRTYVKFTANEQADLFIFVWYPTKPLRIIKLDSTGKVGYYKQIKPDIKPPIISGNIYPGHFDFDNKGSLFFSGNILASGGVHYPFVLNWEQANIDKKLVYIKEDDYSSTLPMTILTDGNSVFGYESLENQTGYVNVLKSTPRYNYLWKKKYLSTKWLGALDLQIKSIPNGDFFYRDGGYDFFRATKNGFVGCGEKDDKIILDSTQLEIKNLPLPGEVHDFIIKEEVINLKEWSASSNLEILCSNTLYPKANLGNDTVLCSEKSLTLNAYQDTSGFSYLWNNGSTDSAITIDSSGNYSLSVSYGQCTASDDITVIFKDQIKANIDDTAICPYDSVLLATSKFEHNPLVWISPENDTIRSNTLWAKDTGKYYLQLGDSFQCKELDTVTISHHPLPVSIAGPDTTLCYNQTYTMQGAGGITFKWIPAIYLSSDSIPNPVAQLPHSQKYMLIVSNAFDCSDTSEVLLEVKPKLEVTMTTSRNELCEGQTVEFSATGKGGNSEDYHFTWLPGNQEGSTISATFQSSSWQKVILSDNCSEPATDSLYITVHPNPEAAFTTIPADTGFVNDAIQFINQSKEASAFDWNFGDGITSNQQAPVYNYKDTGQYEISLAVFNQQGCTDSAYGKIYIEAGYTVFIPNAFTVNGDQINDTWKISGNGIKSYSFQVYNSWGMLVYQSKGDHDTWDGTFRGKEVEEPGVFVYRLTVTDKTNAKHFYRGLVHLVK